MLQGVALIKNQGLFGLLVSGFVFPFFGKYITFYQRLLSLLVRNSLREQAIERKRRNKK